MGFSTHRNIFFLIDKLNRHNNDSEIKSQNTQKLARNIVKTCLDVLFCLQVGELIRDSLRVD